eukprot:1497666-Rhodomonas_salina.1
MGCRVSRRSDILFTSPSFPPSPLLFAPHKSFVNLFSLFKSRAHQTTQYHPKRSRALMRCWPHTIATLKQRFALSFWLQPLSQDRDAGDAPEECVPERGGCVGMHPAHDCCAAHLLLRGSIPLSRSPTLTLTLTLCN